ncbi:GHKL domain-containing protein [Enterococcus sp. BWR-S5]|uniref:GHKL domain-containing protein n=1 Tax=Enterococcus sp. BWR-S5 TaxID=2787714 RepID=UPI0019203FCB|nr:GHKL domain-containing protein [Enterococcus sp. BWR-S5]MBL1225481.1 GHKL domain-containing protein [Enterococcus sp. BWR-S5]
MGIFLYVIYMSLTVMLFPLANELLFWHKLTYKKIFLWNSLVVFTILGYQFILHQKGVPFSFFTYQIESVLIAGICFLFMYHFLFRNIRSALFFTLASDIISKLVQVLVHKLVFPEKLIGFLDVTTNKKELLFGILVLLASYVIYVLLIILFKKHVQEIAEINTLFLIEPRVVQYAIPVLLFLFIVPVSNYLTTQSFGLLPFIYVLLLLFASALLTINQIVQNVIIFKIRTMYITTLEDYNVSVAEAAKNLLLFKHDYKNVLLMLNSFIEEKDMKGLTRFFSEELLPENQQIDDEDQHYLVLSQIDNAIIRSLIFSKYLEAKKRNILFSIAIMERIPTIFEHPVVVNRILGNLLDNAIEAAAESDERKITLKLYYFSVHELQVVITNTSKNTETELAQLKQMGYSSKEQHLGLGLTSIQALSTDRIYVDYKKETTWFEATIHIVL